MRSLCVVAFWWVGSGASWGWCWRWRMPWRLWPLAVVGVQRRSRLFISHNLDSLPMLLGLSVLPLRLWARHLVHQLPGIRSCRRSFPSCSPVAISPLGTVVSAVHFCLRQWGLGHPRRRGRLFFGFLWLFLGLLLLRYWGVVLGLSWTWLGLNMLLISRLCLDGRVW